MNPITAIMGLADLLAYGLVIFAFGMNPFTAILGLVGIAKGVVSFI